MLYPCSLSISFVSIKLFNEKRLKPEILYYSDILGMSWEEAKEKYLGEVGR